MSPTDVPAAALDRLRARRPGFVVVDGDELWDASRQAFNLAVDQRPELVAFPVDADDVVAVVDFARESGLRVAAQRTGHAASAIDSMEGAVLLKTDLMAGAQVDADARTARVGAGARWGDVVEQASPHGMSPLAGSSPGVGVVGFTLGGGLSFLGRTHGLATNRVTAVELVTADGRKLRVDADNEPELFWALRGGGGSFGIVTALEFSLVEASAIYAGALFFPFERSAEVMHAWHALTATAPDALALIGRFLQVPDIPGPPPPLRGRSFAVVEAVFLGSESDGADLLAPLRDLGPEIDTVATVEPIGLTQIHMDPPEPVPSRTGHMLVGDLPSEAIDVLVEAAGPESGSVLVSVELRQLEGALAREATGAGALATLPGRYAMFAVGALMDPALAPVVGEQLDRVRAALASCDVGRRYFNFVDGAADASAFFDADTYRRLQAVKAAWDPESLFVASHPVL